jgi:ankyrin repeat protein
MMIKRGSDKDRVNNVGNTPLSVAVGSGHNDIGLLLLQLGANPNVQSLSVDTKALLEYNQIKEQTVEEC